MRFEEAEQKYRELEANLVRGELKEEDFLLEIGQLRVVDQEGRRWMLSARTGRWMVHDGQRWVFAQPPEEQPEPEPQAPAPSAPEPAAPVTTPAKPTQPQPTKSSGTRTRAPRMMTAGIASLILVACIVGGGISAWVFFLRGWVDITPVPTAPTQVGFVRTYTPRPATPTYTPTFTPTPSRTPTPTLTPAATDTPLPTDTPRSTDTPAPTNTPPLASTPTPTWTPLVLSVTKEAGSTPQASTTAEASATTPEATSTGALPGETAVVVVTSTPSSTTTPTSSPTSTSTAAPPSGQTYVVQKGDTLFEIALRFGVSVEALAEANGITNTKLIRPGQVLVIPVPGTTPQPPTVTPTPSRTATAEATTRSTATATPRVTSTSAVASAGTPAPTATSAAPTSTPKPTAAPTAKPVALSGKIAFTVWNPYINKYELYVSRIDGSGRNMLGEGFRQPQFRQDGNLLAVNGEGSPNYEHLVTMNPSGGDKVEVSNHSEDSYPTWAPDGAIVSYSSSSWGDGVTRLGIVHDMFGKQQAWIPIGTTEIQGSYPFWMSDGRLVYHGCSFLEGGGNCGLYWVGPDGGAYRRLTNHDSDTAPSEAKGRVAFMSSRDGNWEIYSVGSNGGDLKRLTSNNAQDGLPTWSPDGKSIAFVSNRDGAWAIWVMDASGSNQRKLFDLGGSLGGDWTTERISWAP